MSSLDPNHQQQQNNQNHQQNEEDDDDFVVVEGNNTGTSIGNVTFSQQLFSSSSAIHQMNNNSHQHYKRRMFEANFTEVQNDVDDEMYEGDGVELTASKKKSSSNIKARRKRRANENDDDDDQEDDEENQFDDYDDEPTSTTILKTTGDDGEEKPKEEGEKDQVHDISSIIPPDTFEMCDGRFVMSTDTIWYANLFFIYSFGILVGLVLAKPCVEFYSTDLLIPTTSSSGVGDFTPNLNITTTSTLPPLSATATFFSNHSTPTKVPIKETLSSFDCNMALISSCFGFISFFAWVISFVPQLYVNWKRKSIVGQSIAFAYTNFLGFSCYSIFNICLYSFDSIKLEYQERFKTRNDVEINDVLYALFSALCTGINSYQCLFYERGGQKVHKIVPMFIWGSVVLMAGWVVLIVLFFDPNKPSSENPKMINPLDFLYGVGMLKVIVTAVKYAPQVLLNFKRKKTVGMSISQWIMDFTGGIFSLSQEILDAALRNEWVALEGNFVKLLLSVFTLMYDMVFFVQHYCLYAENNEKIINEYKRKMRLARVRELVVGDEEEGRVYE